MHLLVKFIVFEVLCYGIQTTQSFSSSRFTVRYTPSKNYLLQADIGESSTSLNQQRGDGPLKSEQKSSASRPRRSRYKGQLPQQPQQRRRPATKVEVANRQYKEKRQRDKLQRLFTKLLEKESNGDVLTRKFYWTLDFQGFFKE